MITGDREWVDKEFIRKVLVDFKATEIIEGEARGADRLAREVAEELGLGVRPFPADWDRYGRAAGPIRNREMLGQSPVLVLAFHDRIEESKGTRDACIAAKKLGIPVILFGHLKDGSYGVIHELFEDD